MYPWLSVIVHGHLLSIFDFKESPTNSTDTRVNEKDAGQSNSLSVIKANESTSHKDIPCTRVYGRRFWILFLLTVNLMINGFRAIEYVSVMNIYQCYYGVSNLGINWTVSVYSLAYVALIFPASLLSHRFGLRPTILLGSLLGCLSQLVQCLSLNTTGFPLVIASQVISACSFPLLIPIAPRLASVWFGPTEVCRATAVGVLGNMVGNAAAFLIGPSLLSHNCTETELIHRGESIETYSLTAFSVVVFTLVLLTFENQPPTPPNLAEAVKMTKSGYVQSIKTLIKNANFDLLLLGHGIVTASYFSFINLLNEILTPIHPGAEREIGWMGLIAIVSGIFSSYASGFILDRTQRFKETMLGIMILSFLSMCSFTGLLYFQKMWIQFITVAIAGFFLTSSFPAGLEFASEITYPEPESTSSGLMNAASVVFEITFTMSGTAIFNKYGSIASSMLFCVMLLFGIIIISIVKCDYKRRKCNSDETKRNSICLSVPTSVT